MEWHGGCGIIKAVIFKAPYKVIVGEVPVPRLLSPTDAIVRVTTSAICGSDLHIFKGNAGATDGTVLGHEATGIVDSVGGGVENLREGDHVSVPFNIGCGHCTYCESGYTAYCSTVNPGSFGGIYGYPLMGGYQGAQAEYLRVPYADFNLLKLPHSPDLKEDFLLLSDVFPTGWHGLTLSGFTAGDSVVVFGGGPVGLMVAYSAKIRGASDIYVVDSVEERLAMAEKIGATSIHLGNDPVKEILAIRNNRKIDRGVDAVGFPSAGHTDDVTVQQAPILSSLMDMLRPKGGIGIVGVYTSYDANSMNNFSRSGIFQFPFGRLFEMGISIQAGDCNVKQYNETLLKLIVSGVAKPSVIVTHRIPIDKAPEMYSDFAARKTGVIKALIETG